MIFSHSPFDVLGSFHFWALSTLKLLIQKDGEFVTIFQYKFFYNYSMPDDEFLLWKYQIFIQLLNIADIKFRRPNVLKLWTLLHFQNYMKVKLYVTIWIIFCLQGKLGKETNALCTCLPLPAGNPRISSYYLYEYYYVFYYINQ